MKGGGPSKKENKGTKKSEENDADSENTQKNEGRRRSGNPSKYPQVRKNQRGVGGK